MKKFYENKIFIIVSLFLIFGAVAVVASNIGDSGYSGIQVDNYFSGSGKQGITQNVSFNDSENTQHLLQFEDGLLVNYNKINPPIPPSPTFPSEGLISYYSFDNGLEDALGKNNLTNYGTVNTSGKINSARVYNSSLGQYADNPSAVDLVYSDGERSLCAWVYPSEISSDADGIIFGYGSESSNYQLDILRYRQSNSTFFINHNYGDTLGKIAHNQDNWYFICETYDGTTDMLYVNGNSEVNNTITLDTFDDYPLTFGRYPFQSAYWNGKIDEAGIWNRTLNSTEIDALYNGGIGLAYSN